LEKCDRRQLSEAKQKLNGDEEERPALGFCQGHRPWLGPFGQETCDNGKGKGGSYVNRLLVRSASNAYFPELNSAISIPESIDAVREVISKHLKAFKKISSAAKLELWLEDFAPDHIKEPLADTTPDLIFEALATIRGGTDAPEKTEALKRQELRALVGPIDGLLALALDRAALCSNDPFCASHEPNSELEKRYAHGAACHGCLLIAETSCERRNEFLDRALVVPTLIQHDAAFFTNGP